MHVGRALAKLNPKNVRFDVGSGGVPELTSTDIAAALAFVDAGLGRELLCRVWWPDGAALTAKQLDHMLKEIQLTEWTRRESNMFMALERVACHQGQDDLKRATAKYNQAHLESWPNWVVRLEPLELTETYGDIRKAVLEELVSPKKCIHCLGRGESVEGELVAKCKHCDGAGHVAYGPTWRSTRLGMKESSYKKTWAAPYEWLLDYCVGYLQRAEREFSKAIA